MHESVPPTLTGPGAWKAASFPPRYGAGSLGSRWANQDRHGEIPAQIVLDGPHQLPAHITCVPAPGPRMPDLGVRFLGCQEIVGVSMGVTLRSHEQLHRKFLGVPPTPWATDVGGTAMIRQGRSSQ